MKEAIERLAARYGQVLTVYQDEQIHTIRAFYSRIRPGMSKCPTA